MKKTENFQLNQWESTDRILMDDFNNDNDKIDAALASKMGPREIIKTVSLPIATTFDLDVSDIDWNQWDQVGFTLDIVAAGNAESANIICQAQTPTSGVKQYCSNHNLYFSYTAYMPFMMILLPYHDTTRRVEGICIGKYANVGFVQCAFSQLTTLRFIGPSDQFFSSSQTITLWGIR